MQLFPLHLIGHDGSAALIRDGKLVAFASEERFTRLKHGFNLTGHTVLPRRSIDYCLREAGISWNEIDCVAHYCHFTDSAVSHRLDRVSAFLDSRQHKLLQDEYEQALKNRLGGDVVRGQIEEFSRIRLAPGRFVQVRHHLAHAAGAFYSSGFDESLILTLDGYGEEESSWWAIGNSEGIAHIGQIALPTSLGLLYQVITAYLGFRSFGDEYKVMGLSSYGNPSPFKRIFDDLVYYKPDGRYSIRDLCRPDLLSFLEASFGKIDFPGKFSRRAADIAASLQRKIEECILNHLSMLNARYKIPNLCMSGGVCLNAVANGAIIRSRLFKRIFIQPAAGDDGASLGAALYAQSIFEKERRPEAINHTFYGPAYGSSTIEQELRKSGLREWRKVDDMPLAAARLIAEGKLVGWFQGRMEMGPRALGSRSILADPRSPDLKDKLNAKIKNRECFRPFAPSVLADDAERYFEIPDDSEYPFMLVTFPVHESVRNSIPAVVHVDGTSRIQTVTPESNPDFHRLISYFRDLTGVPVILNTSFNRAGEPIVNTPEDAIRCFVQSGLDALIIGEYVVRPEK
ncbi:MAG: hypothetical protein A2W25_00800 [candidate division Zixibacteria bacterium RBG_16_53_22]|nr:MAG: hypothetical protein A2W25_00800 [candidate division Zixibacteria bacterium RBG_16_53_22]